LGLEEFVKKQIMFVLALVLSMVLAAPAQQEASADAPASKEDVMKLFAVMKNHDQARSTLEMVMKQMQAMTRAQLKQRHPGITEEDLARMDRESAQFIKNFPVDELLNDMVPVYQRHLTKSDVDAMITFYASPTGQKLLREMPVISAESVQAAYPRIQRELDAIAKRMDEKASQPPAATTPVEKN
jgi:uncharacterized protein